MKKILSSLLVVAVSVTLSCKKSEPVTAAQCSSTIANEYSAAISAYAADPTNTTKCKAVFTILGQLVNCPGVPDATKAEYQKALNDSPCK